MEDEKKDPSLEELYQELEEIIEKMEQRELPLNDAFHLYEKGIKRLKLCSEKIDTIEKKMLILNEQGNLE